MAGELPEAIDRWLRAHDHEVARFGALAPGENDAWPSVGRAVGHAWRAARRSMASFAAGPAPASALPPTRLPGIRAALCADAATAGGAREWNDANVLCLSLRATTVAVAEEMLDGVVCDGADARPHLSRDDRRRRIRAEGPRTRAAPDQSAVHRSVELTLRVRPSLTAVSATVACRPDPRGRF